MAAVTRVKQLERRRAGCYQYSPDNCPSPHPTVIVGDDEQLPANPLCCEWCGAPHLLILTEEIVEAAPPPDPRG